VKLAPGDTVRVRDDWPEAKGAKVHIRTPHFVRGRTGRIERFIGEFADPEALAFGKPGLPKIGLYMVAFERDALFPGTVRGKETLTADLYDTWLEKIA
jgi:nitrile hydratase subunit beta